MAINLWSGSIKWGRVDIPVHLKVGARNSSVIGLNTLHKTCHSQVGTQTWCPKCLVKVGKADVEKGYKAGNGFVLVTDKEIDSMAPITSKEIELKDFVEWSDIDPLYLAESFFVVPQLESHRAYSLLVASLDRTGRVGIGQLSRKRREHLVLIRPKGHGLILQFLWYGNEVNKIREFDTLTSDSFTRDELNLGSQLVEKYSACFEPEEFKNSFEERVAQLIASKQDPGIRAPGRVRHRVASEPKDLAAALRASLALPKARRAKKHAA